MPSFCSTDKDVLVGVKKAWSANRALQFPNNYPLLSHVAVRELIILLLVNKLISGKLTVLQRLQEKAAITSLGGVPGNLLHPRNVDLCSERNKPGLSPKQDSVSDFFMFLILVPEKKNCSQISLTLNVWRLEHICQVLPVCWGFLQKCELSYLFVCTSIYVTSTRYPWSIACSYSG